MTTDEIERKVNKIFVEEFEIEDEKVTPDAQLFQDLGLDSLDAVDLIVALEHEFGGRVADDQAKLVRTVSDVYALIQNTITQKSTAQAAAS